MRFPSFSVATLLLIGSSSLSDAQAISALTVGPKAAAEEKTDVSLPAGASGGFSTSGDGKGDAGALLGVQVWKPGRYLLGAMFNFGGSKELEGAQSVFGSYMLDPGAGGRSLNLVLTNWFGGAGTREKSGWGIFFRGGASFTTWKDPTPPVPAEAKVDGMVLFATAGGQIISRAFAFDSVNEYQFGAEFGYSIRNLGGNLAQADEPRSRLFGTEKTTLGSPELTFFARLNSIQPFFRVTFFDAGADIRSFTGSQGFLGVTVLSSVFRTKK